VHGQRFAAMSQPPHGHDLPLNRINVHAKATAKLGKRR
jgi:hypothetical protein